jgi:tetratricopeptide (TPR) repeat protein
VQVDPLNAQAWSDLAWINSLWARFAENEADALARSAEQSAERALGLSTVCSEFWIRRGVARDMQGRWLEAGKDFQRAVALAPADAYAWYYYADHLSRMKWAGDATSAALRQCLRLDPGNPSGVALRQRLAINLTVH